MKAAIRNWQVPTGAEGWYLDASALVKVYLEEEGSRELDDVLEGRADLVTSELALTETVAAWARRHRDDKLSLAQMASLSRSMFADVESGTYQVVDLSPKAHRAAERLLVTTRDVPLRAADALHVVQGLSAGASVMITFDRHLARAAEAAGLIAMPAHV